MAQDQEIINGNIDKKAADCALKYLQKISEEENISFCILTETYGWKRIEDGKVNEYSSEVPGDGMMIILDEVEGTKNYTNDKRYTTACIINPQNPSLNGVIASSIYRWDGIEYYGSRDGIWVKDWRTEEETKIEKALKIDEMDSRVKIRGCFISRYLKNMEYICRRA